jgi:hypothetical protein
MAANSGSADTNPVTQPGKCSLIVEFASLRGEQKIFIYLFIYLLIAVAIICLVGKK